MSPSTRKVYDAIVALTAEHNRPPTVREIQAVTGVKATASVQWHLNKLQSLGIVDWTPFKARTLHIVKRLED